MVNFDSQYASKIMETAFNNCRKINPDNPLAVAEAMPAMFEALRDAANHCDECGGEGKIRYCPPSEKNWKEGECLICKPWRDALKAAEGRCTNE
jgi:hypothetical protein